KTEQSLPPFAVPSLGPEFKLSYIYSDEKDRNTLPGIDVLNDADVAIISVRRRLLPKEQLDVVRRFIAAGKPIIGIRTASPACAPRPNEKVPEGHDAWLTCDPDVLGGHYTGHHGVGPKVTIAAASGTEQHAILKGIDVSKLAGNGSLYKSAPLAKSATTIL